MELEYRYYKSIDSTNNEIKRIAEEGEKEGIVVSAGEQTSGRGRRGHVWKSPSHDSIATSILLRPGVHTENVSRITILSAMAVCDAIRDKYDLETKIKWPNDVLIDEKKVCGILTELSAENNKVKYVVPGIGVNVHNMTFPEDIKNMATSIDIELKKSGKTIISSRKALTEAIWKSFAGYYDKFIETEDLNGVKIRYNELLVNRGREVRVLDPKGEYSGIALGIDDTGALMVDTGDRIVAVDAGEVSVRGVYGYV
jgi:BirA family transcriptional regulator, biotin operon repressor / biotin---[acetyl-CoA-carboxylase] ligase